ncbi:3,4-dihydroxyphenylacetate 2,3-dioxygenase [Rhizobium sp. Root1204]|uniref:3,4-dihydroxyphenylacetate 2,3-dioxygenase n=1 Tax=Rhizobium sp. Root1204 TaxID=1736428 RepID=UPI000715919E|nr:3,4-dihydroxyphenylacetate 2,3-dioxygenase [Rhizobium sp. Root1204]KQV36986.1 3,4-dihydroxyphenylacetate 2,3-dioxygenase [Rhizobium sp. Root1204]
MIPQWNRNPGFNITRASHVVLSARDLGASKAFYADALGLVVTAETKDALYLRGLEEANHHSLVIRRTDGAPKAEWIGMRVEDEAHIELVASFLAKEGLHHEIADVPFQGKTLRFKDVVGTSVEFVADMPVVNRNMQEFHTFRGGSPQRFDHYQLVTHDVQAASDFWCKLGFRLAEYTAPSGSDELWGTWLERKGNTHDIVFTNGRGPRLHHFAFTVPDVATLIHACDATSSLGYDDIIDRGPGRHGLSNALFVYFRDPDGHRIEFFTTHYQFIDVETPPIRWDLSNPRRAQLWGMPASKRWFFEASEFPDTPVSDPLLVAEPLTLERYLEAQS